jgi:hypothetical protein
LPSILYKQTNESNLLILSLPFVFYYEQLSDMAPPSLALLPMKRESATVASKFITEIAPPD